MGSKYNKVCLGLKARLDWILFIIYCNALSGLASITTAQLFSLDIAQRAFNGKILHQWALSTITYIFGLNNNIHVKPLHYQEPLLTSLLFYIYLRERSLGFKEPSARRLTRVYCTDLIITYLTSFAVFSDLQSFLPKQNAHYTFLLQ